MSEENVEWVRRVAEAWGKGDTTAVEALFEGRLLPNSELHPLYLDQAYKGVDAVRQLLATIAEMWDDYRVVIEEITDLDTHVLAVGRMTARGRGSGVPIEQPLAMLARFQGEQIVWTKSFRSKQEALEAAGLPE
jgi:ketosteroid isomerase-like protein